MLLPGCYVVIAVVTIIIMIGIGFSSLFSKLRGENTSLFFGCLGIREEPFRKAPSLKGLRISGVSSQLFYISQQTGPGYNPGQDRRLGSTFANQDQRLVWAGEAGKGLRAQ